MLDLATGILKYRDLTIGPTTKLTDFFKFTTDKMDIHIHRGGCGIIRLKKPVVSNGLRASVAIFLDEEFESKYLRIWPSTQGHPELDGTLDASKAWLRGAVGEYQETKDSVFGKYEWGDMYAQYSFDPHNGWVDGFIKVIYSNCADQNTGKCEIPQYVREAEDMLDLTTGILKVGDMIITPDITLDDFLKYPKDKVQIRMHNGIDNCGIIHFTERIPSNGIEAGVTIELTEGLDIKDVRILPAIKDLDRMSLLEASKKWFRGFAAGGYQETNTYIGGAYPWGFFSVVYTKDQHYGRVEGGIEISYGFHKCRPETAYDAVILRSRTNTKYMCQDSWQMATIMDDHIYICTTDAQHVQILKQEQPDYVAGSFTDQATIDYCLKDNVLDNSRLNRILQVAPFLAGDDYDPTYKPHVECLYIDKDRLETVYGTRDFNAAVAKCKANNQFGEGGGNQGYNPHIAEMIENGCLSHNADDGYSDPDMTTLPSIMRNHRIMANSVCSMDIYAKMMLDAKIRAVDCVVRQAASPAKNDNNNNKDDNTCMENNLSDSEKELVHTEPVSQDEEQAATGDIEAENHLPARTQEHKDCATQYFCADMLNLHSFGPSATNTLQQMLSKMELSSDDILIIFEDNRNFCRKLYRQGDIVISHGDAAVGVNGQPDYWNIFHEVSSELTQDTSAAEMVQILFRERTSQQDKMRFPHVVQELFLSAMLHFVRYIRATNTYQYWNNASFVDFTLSKSSDEIREMLASYSDMHSLLVYVQESNSPQTQWLFYEFRQTARELFPGNFAKSGSLGIRDLIRDRGGRRVFVETEGLCGPIYTLLSEIAIQEAEKQKDRKGSIYILHAEGKAHSDQA